MKYLKSYKLFESIDLNHLVSTINDISLELTDEGYKVTTQLKDDDSIKIKVTSPRKESLHSDWRQDRENYSVKEYNKCKEVLDRIDELLISNKLTIDSKNGFDIDAEPWSSYTDMEYGICSPGYDSTGTWTYEMTYTSLDVNESKTFESNTKISDLEYDIKDIFLAEVDEERFYITFSPQRDYIMCCVTLEDISFEDDGHEGFRLGELKEFLLRLKNYLIGKGYASTPLTIIIHDGMDYDDHSRSKIHLSEKDIDKTDKWYNTIDAPGLLRVYLGITP